MIQRCVTLCLLLFAVGCGGLNEAEFQEGYTQARCDYLIACGDPAILTFDGIQGVEDCIPLQAPETTALGTGCKKFRKKRAAECVAAIESLACPDEGFAFDEPSVCGEVYDKCDGSGATEDTDDGSGEGGDTDTDAG